MLNTTANPFVFPRSLHIRNTLQAKLRVIATNNNIHVCLYPGHGVDTTVLDSSWSGYVRAD